MKSKFFQQFLILSILLLCFLGTCFAQNQSPDKKSNSASELKKTSKYKVTFIELGSIRCIPCQKMQSVMKSIEKKYGKQVNVVFHDVWTKEGKPFGQQYGIQAIPTQVFLDENNKEFFRHEGYFPEDELIKVLKTKNIR